MKNTDFVKISTRVRASLGTLSHADRISKAIDSSSNIATLTSVVRSMMMQDAASPESEGLDALCDAYLEYACSLVREFSPVPGLYDSLLYKYDAANLKLCIKSSLRSLPPSALFPFGTRSAAEAIKAVETCDFSAYPDGLRRGCENAISAYSETGDAMTIDLAIDAGVFEDIAKSAEESGVDILRKIASLDADSANITAFARISRLELPYEAKKTLFVRAFVTGGKIAKESYPVSEMTADALVTAVRRTYLADVLQSQEDSDDFVKLLESSLSRRRKSLCDGVKFVAFSPDVPAAYILERESEVRAFSLIGAYIQRGASQQDIRAALA